MAAAAATVMGATATETVTAMEMLMETSQTVWRDGGNYHSWC